VPVKFCCHVLSLCSCIQTNFVFIYFLFFFYFFFIYLGICVE
jgi:hypothetical protein